jgi:2-keto-4-pentenoate hydratase/2-oxohepta-3-ene-1,7-dioic acid hydratase in catechol pathway
MKIGFFNDYQLGVVKGDHIVDFMPALGEVHVHDPQELIVAVIESWADIRDDVAKYVKENAGTPLSEVSIRPPLPRPGTIVCMAVNYLENGTRPMPDIDAFLKSSDCVIGDGDTIYMDPDCNARVFHHEAELAVVIGKDTTHVKEQDAMEHVFGYTGFIDVSGRINVRNTQSYYQSKSWPTFGPLGPFIVTKDEIPEPHKLDIRIINSGEPRQSFNTDDMAHKIPECIEFSSRVTPLRAGDIISTGTNHQGLGPIQDGDEITLEIEKIGAMRLKVHDPLKREWPRGVDQAMADRMREGGNR